MFPSTHQSLLDAMSDDLRREDAWAKFYQRYGDVIIQWCHNRGLQNSSAEDMAQEILMRLYQRLDRYDRSRSFRAWLKSVVHNALTDMYRKHNRTPHENATGGSVFQQWISNLQDEHALDELTSAFQSRQDLIAAEIFTRVRQRVSETSWHAFYATMVENREATDVANELGLKTGSIYKAVYRIRKLISQEYADAYQLIDA